MPRRDRAANVGAAVSSLGPSPRRRALWAVVAVACLLGQVLGVLHMGLIQHRRCAAHGELVEGGATLAELFDAAPTAGQPAFVAHAQGGDHDHDHCQVRGERVVPRLAAVTAAPLLLIPPGAVAPVARPAIVAVGLFRLAPKASPPAAA